MLKVTVHASKARPDDPVPPPPLTQIRWLPVLLDTNWVTTSPSHGSNALARASHATSIGAQGPSELTDVSVHSSVPRPLAYFGCTQIYTSAHELLFASVVKRRLSIEATVLPPSVVQHTWWVSSGDTCTDWVRDIWPQDASLLVDGQPMTRCAERPDNPDWVSLAAGIQWSRLSTRDVGDVDCPGGATPSGGTEVLFEVREAARVRRIRCTVPLPF